MKVVQFEKNNLPELVELFNISMPRDLFSIELLTENVIEDMYETPELCLTVLHNEKLIGFGMGVIRHRKDEDIGYIKFLTVHTHFRRKGIGSDIYSRIEKGIIKHGISKIRLVESWPNYYMPGIDPFYTEAVAFFERKGYKKIADAANLICDLENQDFDTSKEESSLDSNLEIRRAKKSDFDALMEWIEQNFAAWRFEMINAYKNNPISLHIAKLDEKIIAFSAHSSNNTGLAWFGPIGTTEAARGKGVGGILLKRCLNDMKNNGSKRAIIPWVAHIPFYMHYIDSKVDRVFWRYEKILN